MDTRIKVCELICHLILFMRFETKEKKKRERNRLKTEEMKEREINILLKKTSLALSLRVNCNGY